MYTPNSDSERRILTFGRLGRWESGSSSSELLEGVGSFLRAWAASSESGGRYLLCMYVSVWKCMEVYGSVCS